MMDLPEDWPVARYRLTFEVTKPMTLPDYGGSAIRGAFGHALRRTACMTHQTSCPSCPLYRTCPYAAIFEPPPPAEHELQRFSSVPVPYVIEAPLGGRRTIEAGERLSFTVVLFGRAIEQLALIIYAFERAFRHEVFQGGGELQSWVWLPQEGGEVEVWSKDEPKIKPHQPVLRLPVDVGAPAVRLRFLTQLRLQHNGRAYGPGNIELQPFLSALIRRSSLLREFHAEKHVFDFKGLMELASDVRGEPAFDWKYWRRFSTRQKQGMYMGGVTGEWVLRDVPAELVYFLGLGSWIHVGKNASFGLGRYELILM